MQNLDNVMRTNIFEVRFFEKNYHQIEILNEILSKFIRISKDEVICIFNDYLEYESIFENDIKNIVKLELYLANNKGEVLRKQSFDAAYEERAYSYEYPLDYSSNNAVTRAIKFKVIEK